jgi:Zn-dependent M28 family amino/carboxypeptidase
MQTLRNSLFILLLSPFCSPAHSAAIPSPKDFDPAALKAEMTRFIKASKPNRSVGMPGHKSAAEYILKEFEKILKKSTYGGKTYVHTFNPDVDFAIESYKNDFKNMVETKFTPEHEEYKKWNGFTEQAIQFVSKYRKQPGQNIILELKGSKNPAEIVYIGTHYDTITHNQGTMQFTPLEPTDGADDNASGVIALLAVAQAVAASQHERTIRFVAFDYEEIFFLGSYALAKDLIDKKTPWKSDNESVLGLFNLEMLGHSKTPISKSPIVKIYAREESQLQSKMDVNLANYFIKAATDFKTKIKPTLMQNGFNRSDNWSFWQKQIPSICISQDWENDFNEKNYHSQRDSIEKINFEYLSEISKALLGTLMLASVSK